MPEEGWLIEDYFECHWWCIANEKYIPKLIEYAKYVRVIVKTLLYRPFFRYYGHYHMSDSHSSTWVVRTLEFCLMREIVFD